jgi:hypothetical protein
MGPYMSVSDARTCPMCPDRPKREPDLGHKWVMRGLFVRLGSPTGNTFTYIFVRADTFGPRVVEWVAMLEMSLEHLHSGSSKGPHSDLGAAGAKF